MSFDDINKDLHDALPFMDSMFGRAWKLRRKIAERTYIIPACYKSGMDYVDLSPTDTYGNYSFWAIDDATELYVNPNGGTKTVPASLVFWIDLRKVSSGIFIRRDTSTVRDMIIRALAKYVPRFRMKKAYEEPQNVFEGFSLEETDNQFAIQPYYVLRIYGELKIDITC